MRIWKEMKAGYFWHMASKNPFRPFSPDPEQMALWPEVSGNEINGLGETAPRRARLIYWALDHDAIPHGQAQMWFYKQSQRYAGFDAARAQRKRVLDAPLPPVAPVPIERTPEAWTDRLSGFVAEGLCEKIGVAEMDRSWLLEGHETAFTRVIVAGVQHSYEEIAKAPDVVAGLEVMRQYGRAALVSKRIAGWLREEGWDACLLYTSPSPRDRTRSRMPSSA